jgi:hypothetical protein
MLFHMTLEMLFTIQRHYDMYPSSTLINEMRLRVYYIRFPSYSTTKLLQPSSDVTIKLYEIRTCILICGFC